MGLRSLIWWIDVWLPIRRYEARYNPRSGTYLLTWGVWDLWAEDWVGDPRRYRDAARRAARELNRRFNEN